MTTLVWNFADGFTGWLLNKPQKHQFSMTGEGRDLYCRPIGTNMFAEIVLRNVNTILETKMIDRSKIYGQRYNLLLVIPNAGEGVVSTEIIQMNNQLGEQVKYLIDQLKSIKVVSKADNIQTQLNVEDAVKKMNDIMKLLKKGQQQPRGPMGLGEE